MPDGLSVFGPFDRSADILIPRRIFYPARYHRISSSRRTHPVLSRLVFIAVIIVSLFTGICL